MARSSRMTSGQRGTTRYRYSRAVLPPNVEDPAFDFVSDLQAKWAQLEAAGMTDPYKGWRQSAWDEVEDNRRWNPDARPKTVTGNRVWLSTPSVGNRFVRVPSWSIHSRSWIARNYFTGTPVGLQVPVGVKYQGMFPVVTCVRRKVRRMVMFALGKTGKGAKQRRRHRNARSNVRC